MSFHTHDPHWLNRAGALLAAIAAGAILLQIKAELQIEKAREALIKQAKAPQTHQDIITPLDALEARLIANRAEFRGAELARARLTVALFVIGTAVVGELLHGFGDLLMCFVFAVCASH
jgi:hypothetical protein